MTPKVVDDVGDDPNVGSDGEYEDENPRQDNYVFVEGESLNVNEQELDIVQEEEPENEAKVPLDEPEVDGVDDNESIDQEPVTESRPSRSVEPPEHYNPQTGKSYGQIEVCHNILCQNVPAENVLSYSEQEVAVVAHTIIKMQRCFAQQFNLQKGLK